MAWSEKELPFRSEARAGNPAHSGPAEGVSRPGEVEHLMTQHALSQRGAWRTCARCHAPEPRQTPDPASEPTSHRSPTCPYGLKGVTPPCPCPSSHATTSLTWSGQPAREQAGGHSVSLTSQRRKPWLERCSDLPKVAELVNSGI